MFGKNGFFRCLKISANGKEVFMFGTNEMIDLNVGWRFCNL